MKTSKLIYTFFTLTLLFSCSSPKFSSKNSTTLFGENSNNWSTEGEASWIFEDGVLIGTADSLAGFVVSKASFKNFELTLEFNPDSTINSGVYVRCVGGGTTPDNCYEINIWDLHPNQEYRTGAVVFKAEPLTFVETLNKWNTYRVRCEDGRIQAWVNGEQTADLQDMDFKEGYIGLQAASVGKIRFRKVNVTEL